MIIFICIVNLAVVLNKTYQASQACWRALNKSSGRVRVRKAGFSACQAAFLKVKEKGRGNHSDPVVKVEGDDPLWRELFWLLLHRGWEGGKWCHGWGWAVLMPQVSASTGGYRLSLQEGGEEVVLRCWAVVHSPHVPWSCEERLRCCPLPVSLFLKNGGQSIGSHYPLSEGLGGSLVVGHPLMRF